MPIPPLSFFVPAAANDLHWPPRASCVHSMARSRTADIAILQDREHPQRGCAPAHPGDFAGGGPVRGGIRPRLCASERPAGAQMEPQVCMAWWPLRNMRHHADVPCSPITFPVRHSIRRPQQSATFHVMMHDGGISLFGSSSCAAQAVGACVLDHLAAHRPRTAAEQARAPAGARQKPRRVSAALHVKSDSTGPHSNLFSLHTRIAASGGWLIPSWNLLAGTLRTPTHASVSSPCDTPFADTWHHHASDARSPDNVPPLCA